MTATSSAAADQELLAPLAGRAAGLAAIGSALASVAWLVGLAPADEFPDRWITVWNALLVPAAAWLGYVLVRANEPRLAMVAALAGLAGITSCVLWATSWQRADLEAVWIGLSAAWWIVTGLLLVRRGARWLGWLTVVLGAFAGLDALVTWAGNEGFLFLLASPKLPLAWAWAFAVGVRLVGDPTLEPDTR
jgi:hypothetical protein